MYFRDRDGNAVNQRGYLIDETTGDLRSQYTFDVVFKNYNLIGIGNSRFELPLPYRLERHNFNPHHCVGNFDYDDEDKPIILQDGEGNRMLIVQVCLFVVDTHAEKGYSYISHYE